MSRVRARRLGWNEQNTVRNRDILEPYEASNDVVEGDLVIVEATGPLTRRHDVYLVDGHPVDPDTVETLAG